LAFYYFFFLTAKAVDPGTNKQLGGVSVYGWGCGANGQLGDGFRESVPYPVEPDSFFLLNLESVVQVAAGMSHTLALTATGVVFSWGLGTYGAVGDGFFTSQAIPVLVDYSIFGGEPIVFIAAGGHHSLAIALSGRVYAWGANVRGQLGDGSNINQGSPVAVIMDGALDGQNVTRVSAGDSFSLAVTSDGRVFAWGSNDFGTLGNGSPLGSASNVPVEVGVDGDMAEHHIMWVSAGFSHAFALSDDSRVFAWGANLHGEFGNGNTTGSNVPVAVNMTGTDLENREIVSIIASLDRSYAITADGQVFSWGFDNNMGSLGDDQYGSSRNLPFPIPRSVFYGNDVVELAAGRQHACALTSSGEVFSWGSNHMGQLGNEKFIPQARPGPIAEPIETDMPVVTAIAAGYNTCHMIASTSVTPTSTPYTSNTYSYTYSYTPTPSLTPTPTCAPTYPPDLTFTCTVSGFTEDNEELNQVYTANPGSIFNGQPLYVSADGNFVIRNPLFDGVWDFCSPTLECFSSIGRAAYSAIDPDCGTPSNVVGCWGDTCDSVEIVCDPCIPDASTAVLPGGDWLGLLNFSIL
jgi:alpha-tubulin suppressor-like RCC1 family protein